MNSPIDDAIAEAKAQASRLPAIINARKLTMSDLEASSLDVESWLQVDKYGNTSTSRRRHSSRSLSRSTSTRSCRFTWCGSARTRRTTAGLTTA